ncbi:MAG TPA: hypothetical protein VGF55_15185 [Gemmataceae bacterium]|jgi:hypothetical protein
MTVSTDDRPTLTSAEVKELLREVAFVIWHSRKIKVEIAAGARAAAHAAEPSRPATCAA